MEYFDNSPTRLTESHLPEMLYFSGHPHIHLHAVTAASDYLKEDGVCELACHGCGCSTYVLFNLNTMLKFPDGHPVMQELKYEFVDNHAACRDTLVMIEDVDLMGDDFKTACPPHRGKTITISVKC